mgnify:CR=1 FL=1
MSNQGAPRGRGSAGVKEAPNQDSAYREYVRPKNTEMTGVPIYRDGFLIVSSRRAILLT